jgi:hypothetical protein
MSDPALERGHEVYLVDGSTRRLRVSLQPSWALAPGCRLANSMRGASTRTQTMNTASMSLGLAGSTLLGALWVVTASIRWLAYHLRRHRDWTVTVSSYETHPVALAGRRVPVEGRSVQTLESSQHDDLASALVTAKARAATLVHEGYRPTPYPVAWDDR